MAPPRRIGPRPGRTLAVLAVLFIIMLVGITGKQTFSPAKWQQQFKVGLGLDLSSGTSVILKAYTPNGTPPTAGDMQQAINIMNSRVNGTGTTGASVNQQGTDQINISVPGQNSQQVINEIASTAKLAFRPVLLWQPYLGTTKPAASASPSPTHPATPSPSATKTAKTSALVVPAGATPGTPPNATPGSPPNATSPAAPAASSTAQASSLPSPSASSTASSATGPFGAPTKVNAATMKLFNELVCKPGVNANTPSDAWKSSVGYNNQQAQWDVVGNQTVSCDATGAKFVLGPAVFTGEQVTSANPGLQQNSTSWVVNITLDSQAASAFQKLTQQQYSSYFPQASSNENDAVLDQAAVVLGGNVISAPETQGVLSANFEINGGSTGFTEQQANNLANVVKYGQLPLNFVQESVTSVSPTLGHNSLIAGLIAGAIGLVIVVIYLFLYYRGLGFLAVTSLSIAALLAYFGVVLLTRYANFTMTLAGIAGLIVAIGITADSFIVYFERLRDEVREGKQLRPAVESGWKRARRTILVSDTVSFLAAVLLYKFATTDVQGFAFTLGLTTLIDVLVVFTYTKPMMTLLAGTKFFGGGHRWSGLDPKRLGARAPWRSGVRRTQRTPRTATASATKPPTSSTTPREA